MTTEIEGFYTSDYCNQLRSTARNISFIICALIALLVVVEHDTEELSSEFDYSNILSYILLKAICLLQLGFTLVFFYIWFTLRQPLALKKYD